MVEARIKYQGRIYFERLVFANIYSGIVSKLNQFFGLFFYLNLVSKILTEFKSVQIRDLKYFLIEIVITHILLSFELILNLDILV